LAAGRAAGRRWHQCVTGPWAGSHAAPEPAASVLPPRAIPVVIDGGDRVCVRLLLELRARISGLPAGTVIHLIATGPASPWRRRG
ncbi:MAG: hypothetical protein ACRDNZ_09725, partial [Streptosporangiaceae bacterium]